MIKLIVSEIPIPYLHLTHYTDILISFTCAMKEGKMRNKKKNI